MGKKGENFRTRKASALIHLSKSLPIVQCSPVFEKTVESVNGGIAKNIDSHQKYRKCKFRTRGGGQD